MLSGRKKKSRKKELTAHSTNTERRLRILQVVEGVEGVVVVRSSIHKFGALGVVEDVLDVGGLHGGGAKTKTEKT